ncbi:uncharacterized protein HHUB_3392 [Halobacterium hubeiense]|uniref:Uncharacterized protein n=1 Tax=Halobacterium hubeiense TaxID=1407499 RepID=A0A0U5H4X7_9EURY|nr:uncharacterized protein HHUB_3392 [Halobacterium hubeiense]
MCAKNTGDGACDDYDEERDGDKSDQSAVKVKVRDCGASDGSDEILTPVSPARRPPTEKTGDSEPVRNYRSSTGTNSRSSSPT